MSEREYTDLLVIHCADTKPSMMHVNEDEIRRWHIEERGWSDAGYNMVIPRQPSDPNTGFIEIARPLDHRGAHVAGYNHRALGVCLVGGMSEDGGIEDNFLPAQWEALVAAVFFALEVYPGIKIVGHHDLDHRKTCPNFDAQAWAQRHGFPTP
jgi:hypothetical protein